MARTSRTNERRLIGLPVTSMTDERLLRRLRRGDTAALDEIMDRFGRYVAAVIINQLGTFSTTEDAEELTSNVFYSLWKHCGELRSDNLRGWLAAAARNEARTFLRRHHFDTVDIDDVAAADERCVEAEMGRSEQLDAIRSTLDVLDDVSREIFIRHYYYDQTVAAIARLMDINVSTVKSRLRRGRERLRGELVKGGFCYED